MAASACSCANAPIAFIFIHQAYFMILMGLFISIRLCLCLARFLPGIEEGAATTRSSSQGGVLRPTLAGEICPRLNCYLSLIPADCPFN
jgi:hypothetical protein